jgi:hypothetical protein
MNEADKKSIQELVDGLDPIDWKQMELTAKLSPADRVLAGMRATAFVKSALRGTFSRRFPELSLPELNMKVLRYLTLVRMQENE